VKFQNPCDHQYPKGGSFADMVIPPVNVGEIEQQPQMRVTIDEFNAIVHDCLSFYRTKDRLKRSNFLAHLLRLPPGHGLRLATAEMTIQGYDNGGDILRMANNIMKLEQTREFIQQQSNAAEDPTTNNSYYYNKELQIHTMSLDEFIVQPAVSALEFFNFVLGGDNTNDKLQRRMEEVARKYEKHYYDKIKAGVDHVTHDKVGNDDREQLMNYLKSDEVFGPPLHKIEMLVENAVASRRQYGGMPT
jgi:hypothetical protein